MLVTDMSFSRAQCTQESSRLFRNMFDSAIYMLYQDQFDRRYAVLCVFGERCSKDDIDVREKYLKSGTDFSDFVMFRLYDDLSVELLDRLPAELERREKSHVRSRSLD